MCSRERSDSVLPTERARPLDGGRARDYARGFHARRWRSRSSPPRGHLAGHALLHRHALRAAPERGAAPRDRHTARRAVLKTTRESRARLLIVMADEPPPPPLAAVLPPDRYP